MTSISVNTITRCGTTRDFTRATPQSVAVMQLGGTLTSPGLSRSGECRVCGHPARQYIETWLTRGWTCATINDALRGGEAHKLTPAQIESHLSICIGSMNGWNTLVRWTRSQAGEAPTLADWAEEAFGSMLADVQQAIDMGHFMASLKAADMIKIVQMAFDRAEAAKGQLGETVYQQLLGQYWDTVRQHTTVEQQRTIAKALEANPVMRQLTGNAQEPTIVETEGVLITAGGATAWDTEGYLG